MTTAEISRRRFLYLTGMAGTALLTGCYPDKPKPAEKSPTPDQTQEVLKSTHQEVKRLVQKYPPNSIIRAVYLGNLADISPVFTGSLPVGIADPAVAYSRTVFGQAEYTQADRFSYFLNRDRSKESYATLTRQDLAVYFSPVWLNSQNDLVKTLALEKEAYNLALWEPFSRIILNSYLTQGRIDRIDPQVTDMEIARTLARQIFTENLDVRKLYDYAGYLAILQKVGDLLESGDPQIEAELSYSNLPKIYRLAKLGSIKLKDLRFGSPELLKSAFDPDGPWAKIILDPSVPGPVPFNTSR